MKKRLVEEFRIGQRVEVNLSDGSWPSAVVVGLDHPGLWVQDDLGRHWFVTNRRRIRRREDGA